MRILISTDAIGGVWQYTATLTRGLAADGHSVLVAVFGDPRSEQLASLPKEITVEHRDLKLEWMADPEADLREGARWLADLASRWRADLVHLNQMTYAGLTNFTAPTLTVVHSDVHSWYLAVREREPGSEWRSYSEAVTRGLAASDAVVAPSRAQAESTRRHYGSQVVVIHNGVPIPEPVEVHSKAVTPPLILTAGRAWDEAKGIRILEEALTFLPDSAQRAHLLGDSLGPDGVEFHSRRITCKGAVSEADVQQWMRLATIYVAPSRYEPFGLAPAEAAAGGCALVLSDIDTFRELWGDNAEYFPREDARALAAVLEELLSDPERVKRRGMAASKHVRANYSATRFVEDYLSLYQQLAGLTGSGRNGTATIPA